MTLTDKSVAIIGLGYVGLPVAISFGRKLPTVGFDIRQKRVAELREGRDETLEVSAEDLKSATQLKLTADPKDMAACTFFIVAVPTPIDEDNRPDLSPLVGASKSVGAVLKRGDVVCYESTVYPGVTEDVCGPILEQVSGLKCGVDFFLGYSPERINPGDKEHTFERITKVVAGQTPETLDRVAAMYSAVVTAGVHRVIENTQRDLNIALMNELALIFDRMDIRTADVLAAAGTKWNFLKFSPGLVGGHCIGVDPYYLTTKAQQLGYLPEVILAGRRINNHISAFLAEKCVKFLASADQPLSRAKVVILGLTFKENVPDLRNSKVPDIAKELQTYGIKPLIHDPMGDAAEAMHEYGVALSDWSALAGADVVIWAVNHKQYTDKVADVFALLKKGGAIIDVKSTLSPADVPAHLKYWSL